MTTYSAVVRVDQANAPDAESAANATWSDLADLIGQGHELLVEITETNQWGEEGTTLWSVSDTGAVQLGRTRRAVVRNATVESVAPYLPGNYEVHEAGDLVIIEGRDVAGWTLGGYVIPRLASGLIVAEEIL